MTWKLTKITEFENVIGADEEVLRLDVWARHRGKKVVHDQTAEKSSFSKFTCWWKKEPQNNRYLNSVTEMCGAKYIWMSNWMWNHLNAANTRAEVMRHEPEAKLGVDSSHTDLCGRSHFCDTSWSPWWAGRCSCGLYQVGRRWDVPLRAPTCSAPPKK